MTKEKNGIGGGEVPDVVKVNEVSQEELEKKLESGGIIGKFVNITTGKIMGIVVAGGIVFMAMGNSANAFPGPNIWGGVKEMVKDATGGPRVKFIGTTPRPKEQKKPKEQKLAFNLGAAVDGFKKMEQEQRLVTQASVRRADQAEADLVDLMNKAADEDITSDELDRAIELAKVELKRAQQGLANERQGLAEAKAALAFLRGVKAK